MRKDESKCGCACMCVCIWTHVCTHTQIHKQTRTHTCTHHTPPKCDFPSSHTSIQIKKHTHMHTLMHHPNAKQDDFPSSHTNTQINTHTRMHTHVHTSHKPPQCETWQLSITHKCTNKWAHTHAHTHITHTSQMWNMTTFHRLIASSEVPSALPNDDPPHPPPRQEVPFAREGSHNPCPVTVFADSRLNKDFYLHGHIRVCMRAYAYCTSTYIMISCVYGQTYTWIYVKIFIRQQNHVYAAYVGACTYECMRACVRVLRMRLVHAQTPFWIRTQAQTHTRIIRV